jgi:hypothetical protein
LKNGGIPRCRRLGTTAGEFRQGRIVEVHFISPFAPFSVGAPGASGATPKSEAVSRSALLGGPDGIPVSETRTNPEGGIQAGGADKAERRRAQGVARPSGRQAQLSPTENGANENDRVASDDLAGSRW